jgi:hypothetical protein
VALLLYDPTVDDLIETPRSATAPRLEGLNGKRIALLANGKVNADVLLRQIGTLFEEHYGCRVVVEENKGNATRPADPALLKRIAGLDVDFMVTAVGD